MTLPFHILATATKEIRIFTLRLVKKELTSGKLDYSRNSTGIFRRCHCVRLWKAGHMDNQKYPEG
ncbi:hypothetical protein U0070_005007 [Myodes glareolus]|uniref:Uncharacterized protein n=1 Tax=Myodes glareolus TaxID=447135 RepID=A0AAW0K664_MYOGA